jgi:peptide/nickel transport system ATP-binding protein
MYLGRIVESAPTAELWANARHPYTQALLAAIPDPSRRKQAAPISGDLPSPHNPPSGCRFHTRCPLATDICRAEDPASRQFGNGHAVACHHAQ